MPSPRHARCAPLALGLAMVVGLGLLAAPVSASAATGTVTANEGPTFASVARSNAALRARMASYLGTRSGRATVSFYDTVTKRSFT